MEKLSFIIFWQNGQPYDPIPRKSGATCKQFQETNFKRKFINLLSKAETIMTHDQSQMRFYALISCAF